MSSELKTGMSLDDIVPELFELEEDDLFDLLGLQIYAGMDCGVEKRDYSKDQSYESDKLKAEEILGREMSSDEYNEICYLDARLNTVHKMLENGEITDEEIDPSSDRFDKSYNPDVNLLRIYKKITSCPDS
ncbi:MAG: hypothetical protein KAJ88_03910 [Candidatus Aenigmarchaeota archaeon]|nr:hypothetical protein [Candidatus Aenigmarchaeota archaeon]